MLKKINAVLGLLGVAVLLGHAGTMSYSMLTGWYDFAVCKGLAHAVAALVAAHIAVTLVIFFFKHEGSNLTDYPRNNARTIFQRSSGLVVVALLHAHVQDFGFIVSGEPLGASHKALLCLVELVFFAAIFVHVVTSFGNALLTLGLVGSGQALERVDRATVVLCGLACLVTMGSLLRFVLLW